MASICLIGEDSLLIQCGEILLNRHHSIQVIVSPVKKIESWARKNHISYFKTINELSQLEYSMNIDYIFSIVNSCILPPSFLELACRAAINYHDSPLPKYAGLHSTSWAILNEEKEHGVTWHLMNQEIDRGAIIKQSFFPIESKDTAFTLNLKCYERAIETFQTLIVEIEQDQLTFQKQTLLNRSYYSAKHQLPYFGFIHWPSFSAEKIECIHRALTFDHYNNNLGTLKIYLTPNEYVIISKLELSSYPTQKFSSPGQVLFIEENAIHISTTTSLIKISQILLPDSDQISIKEFLKKFKIQVRFQFPFLKSNEISLLKSLYSQALVSEKFWIRSLKDNQQHTIFSRKEIAMRSELQMLSHTVNVKHIFPNKKIDSIINILLTAIIIYLYRINNHEKVSVFLIYQNFKKFHKKCGDIFNYFLPINFDNPSNLTLKETIEKISALTQEMRENQGYLSDIFARHPILKENSIEKNITISFTNQFKTAYLADESILHFQINEELGEIQIFHRFDSSSKLAIKELLSSLPEHITNILINLINRSHLPLTYFSFLPEHEQYRLLNNFSKGVRKGLPATSIIALFKQQTQKQPKHTALHMQNDTVSYEKLWDDTEKIAHYVKKFQKIKQSHIGIYLERSIEMVTMIFSALKSGVAYVPLDTKYPLSRIKYIIDQANITIIFTQKKFLSLLEDFFKTQSPKLVCIEDILKEDQMSNSIFDLEENNPLDNLAYIMFTSGTTGAPKGVMVTQRNVLNYCHWFLQFTHFDMNSIMDFSSSIAFDLSVPCSIAPLLAGGSIAICSESQKINPCEYLSHLIKNRVSHVEMTPGYMHQLLAYPDKLQRLRYLKYLLLGADVISKTDVIRWYSHCPEHQLINEYGPTETTVAITAYFINKEQLPIESSVPIGQPAFNTDCYVLDRYKNLCPIGMMGELHIGGMQVSKGYLNNPTLTQDKFINSYLNNRSETLYKTGDMVYWLPDGNLQFIGRNDHQIKIFGYRVETAEIESVLTEIPGIHQAIVMEHSEKFKNKYLRAYLVSEIQFVHDDEIRKTLKFYLPNYMIPKEFCLVSSVPLKENEKIDYHALKKQSHFLLTNSKNAVNSTNLNFQEKILKIWQTIFNNSLITVHDNFFDIGGESLLALQIIDELENQYSLQIPVIYLFEYPNVTLLSNKIYELYQAKSLNIQKINSTSPNILVPLSKGKDKTPLFLIHPVGGTIFWYKEIAGLLQGTHTVYGIQDPNMDGHLTHFTSLEEMAEYYLKAIQKIYSGENYRIGGASFGATVAFAITDLLQKQNKEIDFLGLFDGWSHYPALVLKNNSISFTKNNEVNNQKLSKEKKQKLLELEQYRKQLLANYHLPRLKVNATLFKALDLWPEFKAINDAYNGWSPYVDGSINVILTPGDHETMFFPPNAKSLANLLNESLIESTIQKASVVPALA